MGEVLINTRTFISYLSRSLSVFHSLFGQKALVKYVEGLTVHFPCLYGLCNRSQQLKSHSTTPNVYVKRYVRQTSDWTLFRTRFCVDQKRTWEGWGCLSLLVVHFRLILLSFSLQKAALIAYESHCVVFAVPCGCQGLTSIFVPSRSAQEGPSLIIQ